MKLLLAQLNPKVADFEANLEKALAVVGSDAARSADLIVLTELFLMGYPPQDLLERPWFVERQTRALDRLARATENTNAGLVIGGVLPSGTTPGRGLYNAAILMHDGRIVFSQAKTLLPTYDVFDEARYFDPAREWNTVDFKGERLALNVCEDAWNDPGVWQNQPLYGVNPIDRLGEHNPSLFINVSASPFTAGKEAVRYGLISAHARKQNTPFVLCNQVGGNDELIFDGRSMGSGPDGRPIFLMPSFVEETRLVDTNSPPAAEAYPAMEEIESVYRALVLGIRDYMGKSGFSRAVVGLSGGIDSAVTFALAAEALGPGNVLGVSMPSMYSSQGSLDDSERLAENIGAEFRVVPIRRIYDAYVEELGEHFAGRAPDVTEENIQARIRGNILMAFSNKFGHIVLATGNKSELAMGYCTLYGDMAGGLAVLSDVPKVMVYRLAEYMNREREVIPPATIEKPPSAELRPDQKDEDSLPPYPVLDRVLHLYIEEGLSAEAIAGEGIEPDLVDWIVTMIGRNEYKRKQAPPGLKVTSKAFGVGRRMPIVARHGV